MVKKKQKNKKNKKNKKYSIKVSNKKKSNNKKKKKTSLTPIAKMVQDTDSRWYEGMDDEAMMKFQANILAKDASPLVFVERKILRPNMQPGEDAIILAEQRRMIDSPQRRTELSNKIKRKIKFRGGKKSKRRRRKRRRKTTRKKR